jgi:palmitoyl-protein thioesterase
MVYKTAILSIILLLALTNCSYPVAIFHGIGDSCNNNGMKKITKYFADQLNTDAFCIESAGGVGDWTTSFISQAEKACKEINNNPKLNGDFSVVGLSQGSLLARYIIEECKMPGRVKRYVSIGGPQMGVNKFPHCASGPICWVVNKVVDSAVYFSFIQHSIGPAGYFKDVVSYDNYLKGSTFLAELNNEKTNKNNEYKERMLNLERMVLIKFSGDSMIIPKETAWFQFNDKNGKLVDLDKSDFYINDYIGVKQLNEQKKIDFIELNGDHLAFDEDDIDKYMIPALK